jgi:flagellar export protein FliJ
VATFRFGLETLLRHREEIEQKELDELFRRTYKYQIEVNKYNDLSSQLQQTMKELSQRQSENAPHRELDYYHLYLRRLTQEIKESEKRLTLLQSEVQSQKEAVVEAAKKRKTLATMRAKKEKEFLTAVEKQEQKEIDELVVTRYAGKETYAGNE